VFERQRITRFSRSHRITGRRSEEQPACGLFEDADPKVTLNSIEIKDDLAYAIREYTDGAYIRTIV
jgi:hypothetical protein